MRPEKITLSVFDKYSADHMVVIAARMAASIAEQDVIAGEKKTCDAEFNGRLKKCAEEITNLAIAYNKGGETAPLECNIRYDVPVPGKKSYVRPDTEEVLEVHDMNFEEKQETLQFPLAERAEEQPEDPPAAPVVEITAIGFRYFVDIAAVIVALPTHERKNAISDMCSGLAKRLLAQGKVMDREGNAVEVLTIEAAEELALRWLDACVLMAKDDTDKPEVA